MFLEGRGEYNNIVDEHQALLPCQSSQKCVHQTLEGCGGVGQTHRHADELEETKDGDEGRLLGILGGHRDLMEAALGVVGAEIPHIGDPSQAIADVGKGVGILDRSIVQRPVIDDCTVAAVLLWHHDDRETPGASGGTDDSSLEQLLVLSLLGRHLSLRVSSQLALDGKVVSGVDSVRGEVLGIDKVALTVVKSITPLGVEVEQ